MLDYLREPILVPRIVLILMHAVVACAFGWWTVSLFRHLKDRWQMWRSRRRISVKKTPQGVTLIECVNPPCFAATPAECTCDGKVLPPREWLILHTRPNHLKVSEN